MKCQKCGSEKVSVQTSTYTKSKSRSFLWNAIMILFTGGLWIFWMLIRKKKEKVITETQATCQECGYSWRIK